MPRSPEMPTGIRGPPPSPYAAAAARAVGGPGLSRRSIGDVDRDRTVLDLDRDLEGQHHLLEAVVFVDHGARVTTRRQLGQTLAHLGLAGVEDYLDRGLELLEP